MLKLLARLIIPEDRVLFTSLHLVKAFEGCAPTDDPPDSLLWSAKTIRRCRFHTLDAPERARSSKQLETLFLYAPEGFAFHSSLTGRFARPVSHGLRDPAAVRPDDLADRRGMLVEVPGLHAENRLNRPVALAIEVCTLVPLLVAHRFECHQCRVDRRVKLAADGLR